ncbi:hypothetical protein V7x_12200 [Crateriforma conspicua]|uniref:Pilus formation protein N-terminal domain-containing protein n=1 Tax=Crateriforma conspicua TaxID=2527996 RepID=A0A5C6FTH5_9PLAN|nr:hypothetical protein V7x_12200 [Crateriforma conspicua]
MGDRRLQSGQRKNPENVQRFRRRRRLFALLMTAGVSATAWMPAAVAQQPSAAPIRTNPFVQTQPIHQAAVHQTSGRSESAVLLKPMGSVVGLRPIDAASKHQAASAQLSVQAPQPSPIRTNPLLRSTNLGARQLHEVTAGDATKVDADSRAYFNQPPTFAGHVAAGQVVAPESVAPTVDRIRQTAADTVVGSAQPYSFSLADVPERSTDPEVKSESSNGDMVADADDAGRIGEAIEFSLSDSSDEMTVEPAKGPTDQADQESSTMQARPALSKAGLAAAPRIDLAEVPPMTLDSKPEQVDVPEAVAEQTETPVASQEQIADPASVGPAPGHAGHTADAQMRADMDASDAPVVDETRSSVDTESLAAEQRQLPAPQPMEPPAARPEEATPLADPMEAEPVVASEVPKAPTNLDPAVQWRPPVAVAAAPASFRPASDIDASIVRTAPDPIRVDQQSDDTAEQDDTADPSENVAADIPTPMPEAEPVAETEAMTAQTPKLPPLPRGPQTLHWKTPVQKVSARLTPEAGATDAAEAAQQLRATSATPLYMTRAQVRSLTIRGQLHKVSVNDKGVCQAVAAGPSQIKLIGASNGVTHMTVWASPVGSDSVVSREFEVHVTAPVEASHDPASEKMSVLSQAIRHAFPTADVTVQLLADELIVSGHCPSEEAAKKIIRMVRKTCLIPVRDELVVR